jgi:hypothetical protein
MTALLVKGSNGYELRFGRFAGEFATGDVLRSFGGILVNGVPLCDPKNGLAYSLAIGQVCEYADIRIDSRRGGVCNAMSMGAGFLAVPAIRSNAAPRPGPYSVGDRCSGVVVDCPFVLEAGTD